MNPAKAQQIEQELKRLLGEFETMVQTAGDEGAAALGAAQHRLSAAMDDARVRLGQVDARVRHGARYAARATDDYVHERPWQVVAAVALVGFIAGMLIARR